MAVAAIAVGNLRSPALYVSSFHVEVFSDSGYTTLVGSKSCPAVKDSTGDWVQSDLIGFNGLVRGQTYYIQAGPVSPGGSANFNRYSVQAGTITIPACTYSGTYTATSSGVSYDITPATVPADIDHFEASWTKDGSAPSNDSLENAWEGATLANGLLHIFVGGSPGQNIHFFMRAVSTSGGYQNWVAVDNRTISAGGSSGTTNAANVMYADGTTVESLKPGQAGADVTGDNVSADTSAVNGINSGHIADSATSLGFVGKWWRTSSSAPAPPSGGELPYAPMFTTHDANINYMILGYNWAGSIPTPPLNPYPPTFDGQWIYARFTGYYTCSTSGTYTFGTNSDDGSNLYVNGQALVSELLTATSGSLPDRTYHASGTINLSAGQVYEVIVEYRNGVNNAGIQVLMTPPGGSIQLLDLGTAFKSAAYTQYADGTVVDALKPAAAGADVTAVNISADTSSVNGVASHLISPISTLMPAQAGADATANQPIVYSGIGASLIPPFLPTYGLQGWRYDSGAATYGAGNPAIGGGASDIGLLLNTNGDGACSPAFSVIPGHKYRLTFTGRYNSSGSQTIFHRICASSTYAPNILGVNSTDFMSGGNMVGDVVAYTYDWTCPAGIYFASLVVYELGTSQSLYTSITAQDYGAAEEWGADVTGSNTAANTSAVGSLPASVITGTINPGGGVNLAAGTTGSLDNVADGASRYAAAELGADNTLNHVVTAVIQQNLSRVSILNNPLNTPAVYTVATFDVTSKSTDDVFNFQAIMQWEPSGSNVAVAGTPLNWLQGYVDAPAFVGTSPNFGVGQPSSGTYTTFGFGSSSNISSASGVANISFFGSISGLSAGNHTLALAYTNYFNNNPKLDFIYCTCQQISS